MRFIMDAFRERARHIAREASDLLDMAVLAYAAAYIVAWLIYQLFRFAGWFLKEVIKDAYASARQDVAVYVEFSEEHVHLAVRFFLEDLPLGIFEGPLTTPWRYSR